MPRKMAIFRADKWGWPYPRTCQLAIAGTGEPSSRSGERTPTQNFLEVLTDECSSEDRNGPQTAERPRNEGSRRFKSPSPPKSLALAAISGEQREMTAFVAVLSAQPNQRGTNIGVIRRCASVFLRAGTGWFGFAIASAKTLREPWLPMSRT
jgi:hypothetical protein